MDNNRIKIAIQKSGRLTEHTINLLNKCGLVISHTKNQLIGYWSNESFALQPGVAQISAQNAGGRDDNVSNASYDRYLSRLDEKYLKSLAKEVKGNYVNGGDLKNVFWGA